MNLAAALVLTAPADAAGARSGPQALLTSPAPTDSPSPGQPQRPGGNPPRNGNPLPYIAGLVVLLGAGGGTYIYARRQSRRFLE